MPDTLFLILLFIVVAVAVMQMVLLLRKSRVEFPLEWLARLERLESFAQDTLKAVAKNEGALEGMSQQLQGFGQTTGRSLEVLRQTVDEKLALVVAESRSGRSELLAAFGVFENKLDQRLAVTDAAIGQRFDVMQGATKGALESLRRDVDEKLAQTVLETRTSRTDMTAAFGVFEGKQEQRLSAVEAVLGQRFEALQAGTMGSLDASRKALDDKLTQVVAESRSGRSELLAAFGVFENKLDQRLAVTDATTGQRFDAMQGATKGALESLRRDVDEKLTQTVAETRTSRTDLTAAFGVFEGKQEQRLSAVEATLGQRFAALQAGTVGSLDASRKALDDKLALAQADAFAARKEVSGVLTTFRAELTVAVARLASETQQSRSALAESATLMETHIQQRFDALTVATRQTLDSLKSDLSGQLGTMSAAMSGALRDQLEGNGHQIRNQFTVLQDAMSQQLAGLVQGTQQNAEQLRSALNERLAAIQADNTAKLEEMRRTVDEKLHATLEQRLGESFKHVSERLEQVHKGLGEMQTLAQGVGDLKHLLSNVKTRGIFGEAQLANLLEQVFVPDQYAAQVATRPGSKNVVDFAIKLPGNAGHGEPLWLPIDAKFPNEDYERLLDAQGRADAVAADAAGKALELRIRLEAKSISEKYVEPPHTTDFAILFLPTEGLYAEVLRRPGLMEALRREHRVTLAGPTTLLAMLSSLQMGFRTLALQQRSSEVWQVLGAVKTEFGKFGAVLAKVKSQTETVLKTLDTAEVRSRAMGRALKKVEALPDTQVAALIPVDLDFDGEGGASSTRPGLSEDE